jgi:hypothetical protein
MGYRIVLTSVAFFVYASLALCQVAQPATDSDNTPKPESKRLLGIVPNYRTSPSLQTYEPLTTGEKFKVASEDAFDRGTVALAAVFGAENQLADGNHCPYHSPPGPAVFPAWHWQWVGEA